MADSTLSIPAQTFGKAVASPIYYAVYDANMPGSDESWDLAFIEQRQGRSAPSEPTDPGERYFESLHHAKAYVRSCFRSGAEYFSLAQQSSPDSIRHMIADKFAYLMA